MPPSWILSEVVFQAKITSGIAHQSGCQIWWTDLRPWPRAITIERFSVRFDHLKINLAQKHNFMKGELVESRTCNENERNKQIAHERTNQPKNKQTRVITIPPGGCRDAQLIDSLVSCSQQFSKVLFENERQFITALLRLVEVKVHNISYKIHEICVDRHYTVSGKNGPLNI